MSASIVNPLFDGIQVGLLFGIYYTLLKIMLRMK